MLRLVEKQIESNKSSISSTFKRLWFKWNFWLQKGLMSLSVDLIFSSSAILSVIFCSSVTTKQTPAVSLILFGFPIKINKRVRTFILKWIYFNIFSIDVNGFIVTFHVSPAIKIKKHSFYAFLLTVTSSNLIHDRVEIM